MLWWSAHSFLYSPTVCSVRSSSIGPYWSVWVQVGQIINDYEILNKVMFMWYITRVLVTIQKVIILETYHFIHHQQISIEKKMCVWTSSSTENRSRYTVSPVSWKGWCYWSIRATLSFAQIWSWSAPLGPWKALKVPAFWCWPWMPHLLAAVWGEQWFREQILEAKLGEAGRWRILLTTPLQSVQLWW